MISWRNAFKVAIAGAVVFVLVAIIASLLVQVEVTIEVSDDRQPKPQLDGFQ